MNKNVLWSYVQRDTSPIMKQRKYFVSIYRKYVDLDVNHIEEFAN